MKKFNLICVVMLIGFIASLVGIRVYKNQPSYILNQYTKCINEKDYSGAYSLFYKNKQLEGFKQEYITKYLGDYFKRNELISLRKGKVLQKSEDYAAYEATYHFEAKSVTGSIGLNKQNGKWQIIFPFKADTLEVYAPIGSEVIVDNKKLTVKENQNSVKLDLFPGQYEVRIKYPEGIKNDFVTTVNMPKQNQVESPYKTHIVEVKAPVHAMVQLGGNVQRSEEGIVRFENVLEGEYTLKVYDEHNSLEAYQQVINIDPDSTYFEVAKLRLSQNGYEKLTEFTNALYKDYLNGIKQHDDSFWEKYGTVDDMELIAKEYSTWFIDRKDVQDAKINLQIEKVSTEEPSAVRMEILEVVYLTNREMGQPIEYQVVLKWSSLIDISGVNYTLKERVLQESLVSYKDNQGEWIQY